MITESELKDIEEAPGLRAEIQRLREENKFMEDETKRLLQENRRYRKAIDDIYNHNEAARTAVVQHFGLHHPRFESKDPIEAENERLRAKCEGMYEPEVFAQVVAERDTLRAKLERTKEHARRARAENEEVEQAVYDELLAERDALRAEVERLKAEKEEGWDAGRRAFLAGENWLEENKALRAEVEHERGLREIAAKERDELFDLYSTAGTQLAEAREYASYLAAHHVGFCAVSIGTSENCDCRARFARAFLEKYPAEGEK